RVSPDLGEGLDIDALDRRWHQLDPDDAEGVIRVDRQLVLLDEHVRRGVAEVLQNPVIPADQRDAFIQAPGDFFPPEDVDTTISFGVRVAGIGVIVPQTFADATESGISWFGNTDGIQPIDVLGGLLATLPELDKVERDIEVAEEQGRSVVSVGDTIVDITDRPPVDATLANTRERLHQKQADTAAGPAEQQEAADERTPQKAPTVQVGLHVRDMRDLSQRLQAAAARAELPRPVDYDSFLLQPFPHQREGVEWLTALMAASLEGNDGDPGRLQGAILADDMGLGKTYMTLVALREFLTFQHERTGESRPTLAVLPLSLIENWQQ